MRVEFKSKVETIYNMDGTTAYQRIKVPALDRRHCDMAAFRQCKAFGGFANSDLFPSILRGAARKAGLTDYIRLDKIPTCVTVDLTGFLAKVTIELEDAR